MTRFLRYLPCSVGPLVALSAPGSAAPQDCTPGDTPYPGTIAVAVDATDITHAVFSVAETIPVVAPGPLTLLFPTWVPGNHAATARVERLSGLMISSNGQTIAWKRDPVDMHAFHLNVSPGATRIDVRFQYLSATNGDDGRVVMTPEMLNLQWQSLLLYPCGHFARQISFSPTVTLPKAWKFGTQMRAESQTRNQISFPPLSLEALMDSPLFAGRHFRQFDLGMIGNAPVQLDVVADSPGDLKAAPGAIETHRRLIAEAAALFGKPPFDHYDFLLALSEELGGIGTEHLASSENSRDRDYLSDWTDNGLLAHELVHSWNGKARRPADLWSSDFNQPMRDSMLWLYEGQTQFWGFVLAARSGIMSQDQVRDVFARLAAIYSDKPSRSWRPLEDTGNDAIMTRELIDVPWPSWHGSLQDSYSLADLMWLEADGIIRASSGGKRSLDDFARTFFAGGGERPSLYDFNDVVQGLNAVQPYDWAGFLNDHLRNTAASQKDWLRNSGYRLVFEPTPTAAFEEHAKRRSRLDLTSSIGVMLRTAGDGTVNEVIWGSSAFKAGLVPGAVILNVNGQPYSSTRLTKAIEADRGGRPPIRLLVSDRGEQRTVTVDYRGGLRYPRLERVSGVRDRLSDLLGPRARDVP